MKSAQRICVVAFALVLPLPVVAQDRVRVDTTVRINLRGTVDLALLSGTITVRGWDQADVRVTASTETGTLSFVANANRVTLRVVQPEGRRSPAAASYDVSVPRGTRLRLQSIAGNIAASGSQSDISATTVSGVIDVSGARSRVMLESVSGPIRVSQIGGYVRAQNVSGSIRAENVSGRLEAWAINGAIHLIGVRANEIRAETVGGDIVYAGRVATGGIYDFESHSGTIRLTIPRSSSARFQLETVRGAVQADFPITTPVGAGRKGGRVEFVIGDGRATVTARTFSGGISIKSDPDPARPSISVPVVRADSISTPRRDSTPANHKDSVSTIRRDSVPTTR
ncbi:MAG TPA: DUF4097 family beta strand repeat-containing protein [Gemmatimonadaceae bacterium]|nr:DUF4097 family beta strand repeat-containing protein [Gemmatimonadaceae bacterium]